MCSSTLQVPETGRDSHGLHARTERTSVFSVRWASEEVRSKEDALVHVRAGSIYLYISTKGRYYIAIGLLAS